MMDDTVSGGAQAIVGFNHRNYRAMPARFDIRVLPPRDALRSASK
jgi:hypothetical protein